MPESVLIVDDQPSNIDILREILVEFDKKVALNGKLALEIAMSDDPPDIILLDIMMPEMDGYEVIKQLKADKKTFDIPVIFVTAMDKVKNETKGLKLGAVDYITKPVTPAIVLQRVKTHLALRKAHKQEIENHRLKNELIKEKASKIGVQNTVAILDTTVEAIMHILADVATSIVYINQCFDYKTLNKEMIDSAVNNMFDAIKEIENISKGSGLKFNQTKNGIEIQVGDGEFKFSTQYLTLSDKSDH
ncbi:MAG: response regulator [Magnetococcales bacterium]|nr:response regulator [Magnetococcales bacterium]